MTSFQKQEFASISTIAEVPGKALLLFYVSVYTKKASRLRFCTIKRIQFFKIE
jgi:hypothetical protein